MECGCFYCDKCYLDVCNKTINTNYFYYIDSSNIPDQNCFVCQKQMGQSFDLRKKQQLNKIVSNITDPAVLLAKVINAVKF